MTFFKDNYIAYFEDLVHINCKYFIFYLNLNLIKTLLIYLISYAYDPSAIPATH